MKLEKKHYYWIGGIIIGLILIYYFWNSISSALGIGSTTRQFRIGRGTFPSAGFVGEGSAIVNPGTTSGNPIQNNPSRQFFNQTNIIVGAAPCPNGDGTTTSSGQNAYNSKGNIVGCHDGKWGSPN